MSLIFLPPDSGLASRCYHTFVECRRFGLSSSSPPRLGNRKGQEMWEVGWGSRAEQSVK